MNIVRKENATVRQIFDNKRALNYITKDTSPNVSLSVIEANAFSGDISIDKDRIYYILDGELNLYINNERVVLRPGDSVFIDAGSDYKMTGTFKTITVDQPAFGS